MFSLSAKISKQLIVLTLLLGVLVMPVSPLIAEEIAEAQVASPVIVAPVDSSLETTEVTSSETVPAIDCPITNDTASAVSDVAATTSDQMITTSTPVSESVSVDSGIGQGSSPTIEAPVQDDTLSSEAEVTFSTLTVDGQNIPDQVSSDEVLGEEGVFQTLEGEPSITPDSLAISEENPVGQEVSDESLAISDEQNGETGSDINYNPWTESDEESFTTLSQLVDTVGMSEERSFNTASIPFDTLALGPEGTFTTQVVVDDSLVVSAEHSFVTVPSMMDTLAISAERSFSTLDNPINPLAVSDENYFTTSAAPVDVLAISGENNFDTLPGGPIDNSAVSDEKSFTTDTVPVDTLAISDERSFITPTMPTDILAISDELSFTTPATPIDTLAISDEFSFSTEDLPGDTLAVSDEQSFTTLSSPIDNLAVSDELSFTTNSQPTDNLAVSEENSFTTSKSSNPPTPTPGGGGGGRVLGAQTYRCPIYLNKFIKYGAENDRREVFKLQAFLKVFEGFKNLKLTGVYDRPTFDAVKTFQSRYLRDVLKPWALEDSTGFVYITTRLAINNIYCGRDTANSLRFREQVAYEYYQATGEEIGEPVVAPEVDNGYLIVPATTSTSTSSSSMSVVRPSIFLAGVGELLEFIGDNFCWLLNLLLLMLIFFLLWLLWQTGRRDEDSKATTDNLTDIEVPLPPTGAIPLEEIIQSEDEEELSRFAAEDEEKMENLDNNPWQEAIELGPETKADEE